MLTGVSSRRHANGKQSILKIRRTSKSTSQRVVVVRSVKRDLSVLIFRRSLLDLSLVALTESSLSDSNLPLIYHSEKWVHAGSTSAPRSALMHSLQSWNESLVLLISPRAASSKHSFFSSHSVHLATPTELSEVSCQHLSPWDSPHSGHAANRRGYRIPEDSAGWTFPWC